MAIFRFTDTDTLLNIMQQTCTKIMQRKLIQCNDSNTRLHKRTNKIKLQCKKPPIDKYMLFSRCRPSAILDFQKLEISTSGPVQRLNMRHHAKFRKDRSKRSGDMADFRLLKMAAAAILDF